MKKAVVLGATGCMGRHVCAALEARGTEVTAVARRPAPHTDAHHFLALDATACPPERLAEILADQKADTVVNATLGWGEEQHRVNVDLVKTLTGALRLLPAAHRPRLIQLGTVHEYGPMPYGTMADEQLHPAPLTDYARTKLAASRHVLAAEDLDAVVLRVANTIGPHLTQDGFLGSLAARLARTTPGERIELTLADARRDYIDVRDAADAVTRAALTPTLPADKRLFNIGSGSASPITDLVTALVSAASLPPETIVLRPGEIRSQDASVGAGWTCLDTTRARSILGWTPTHTLEASLRAMYETAA
ncbi:NAD-dependent epimerase/dehydratase family protein [Streptomyces sp. NPDC050145]|uniref:NAD-dependent epimerase/dehydratase family protein n=1 Tax=Streptomyces sp. NPDC050145 TaxID=3365602 RepID=UPI0037BA1F8B